LRGAPHPPPHHPDLAPELRVNLQARLDADGRLTTTTDPVPPVPSELAPWAEPGEDLSAIGRLLE
jgi:hypothetical protein